MKKVLIDATALSDQYKNRGIGMYTRNVVERLVKSNKFSWHLICFEDIIGEKSLQGVEFHSLGKVVLSTPKNIILFRKHYLPIIKRIKPDLYFAPHFERGLPIGRCKTCVSMHDVIPLKTGKYSRKGPLANFLKGLFHKYNLKKAKKADLILTISLFSKSELVSVGFGENKVFPVYCGIRDNFTNKNWKGLDEKKILKKHKISQPYIYYYGGFETNKNVDKLLLAFEYVKSERRDLKLVLTDRTLFREGNKIVALSDDAMKTKRIIQESNVKEDIILTGFIDSIEQAVLLDQAECFVHLSSYEGFGLAVTEALAVGCPVIAAEMSCYPEVLGDAAILIDPENIKEVGRTILRILLNSKLREDLSKRGIKRSKRYSWKKNVSKTLELFENLISGDHISTINQKDTTDL